MVNLDFFHKFIFANKSDGINAKEEDTDIFIYA